MTDTAIVEEVFRREHGRAVAVLIRAFGDIDAAEEAVQDAFAVAVERWPRDGAPPAPAGWIIRTAHNRAIDRLRRDAVFQRKQAELALLDQSDEAFEEDAVPDDRLRLIFTCCHPALAPTARVALTLRLLGGLTTPEIARAFLVSESTMAQRLVRAKAKIRYAHIPYRVPEPEELPDRLSAVLAVLYLIYNEGYLSAGGNEASRPDLANEALRLVGVLEELMPDEAEIWGLRASMLLSESRRPARFGPDGELVPLSEQDRSRWDRALVTAGQRLVRRCLLRDRPGPYQIQAAIAAVHSDAPIAADTDWNQILALYDQLMAHTPSPVVALNRAVAIAEVRGPEAALAVIDPLHLDGYYLFHAVRGDLLERLGSKPEAREAYRRAAELTVNPAERRLLERKLSRLTT